VLFASAETAFFFFLPKGRKANTERRYRIHVLADLMFLTVCRYTFAFQYGFEEFS
jgi:hypothetical protein